MSNRLGRLITLALLIGALAACGSPATALPPTAAAPTAAATSAPAPAPSPTPAGLVSPLPTPATDASPLAPQTGTGLANDPAEMLAVILAAPDAYLGQQVTVAGELLAEGNLPNVRFYLAGDGDQRLPVEPWLPLEVAKPAQGGEAPESMANYAGRHVTLTGLLEKGGEELRLVVTNVVHAPTTP